MTGNPVMKITSVGSRLVVGFEVTPELETLFSSRSGDCAVPAPGGRSKGDRDRMKTLRWGMIGCGDVTEVKSGPAFSKADNSRLVAVMRRRGDLAADYARRHGVGRWSTDAEDLISAPDIDAVYVATRTDSHHEYVTRCAAAGKHVYVEKPMGMTHVECLEMIEACERAGVSLWVGYYRRALPRFLAVRDLVEAGAIGSVRAVVSRQSAQLPTMTPENPILWRVNPALSGGGFFFEGACHTLDFLDFLFGPIIDVHSFAANQANAYSPEDIVAATYRFESGVIGSGLWCYTTDHEYEMNEIVGSRGRIQFSTSRPSPIRLFHGDAVDELSIDDPEHVHQPMIQSIVDEINGRGSAASTGISAARTAKVMELILADVHS